MWLNVVLQNLIPLLITVVTPVLLVLANGLLKKLSEKLHFEGLMNYKDSVDEFVLKGIQAVEQKALAAAKSGQPLTSSEEKLADAIKFIEAELEHYNLPAKAADQLAKLVESKLFEMKASAPVAK